MTVHLTQAQQAALDLAIEITQQHPDTDPNTAFDIAERIAPLVAQYAAEWDEDAMLEAAIAEPR